MGNERLYDYDAAGNLIGATDPAGAEVTYTYAPDHGLVDILVPLDRRLVRNIYDDNGRL